MKTIVTLSVLAMLAASPALAQNPSGPSNTNSEQQNKPTQNNGQNSGGPAAVGR